ncbi:MAG: heavy metal translocating P-type ATPase, partial [bacterium]
MKPPRFSPTTVLFAASVLGLVVGGTLWVVSSKSTADWAFAATALLALIPTLITTVRAAIRRSATVDVIALLAILGAVVLGEFLAGAVIGLMLATGRALEEYAANRAERELSSLLKRAP